MQRTFLYACEYSSALDDTIYISLSGLSDKYTSLNIFINTS